MKVKAAPPDPRTLPVLNRYSRGELSAANAAWEIQALRITGCDDPSASELILWTLAVGLPLPGPSREEAEREAEEFLQRQRELKK
jgi:hypothetical protein